MTRELLMWGIPGLYIAIGSAFARWAIRDYLIFTEDQRWEGRIPGGRALTDRDRFQALGAGAICFVFWFAVMPYFATIWVLDRVVKRRLFFTPSELAQRERDEMEKARATAAAHGLEFPEVDHRDR